MATKSDSMIARDGAKESTWQEAISDSFLTADIIPEKIFDTLVVGAGITGDNSRTCCYSTAAGKQVIIAEAHTPRLRHHRWDQCAHQHVR
jgi:hypothetical protein